MWALVGSSSARVGAPARRHVSSVSHRLRGVSTAMWPASVAAPASRSGPAVPLWAQALARPYPVPTGQAAYTSEACSHSPWALLEDLSRHLEASEDVGDEGALGLKTHPSHRSSLPLFLQGHRAHPRPACTIPITSAKTSFPTEVTFQLLRARACMHLLGGYSLTHGTPHTVCPQLYPLPDSPAAASRDRHAGHDNVGRSEVTVAGDKPRIGLSGHDGTLFPQLTLACRPEIQAAGPPLLVM